MQPIATAVFVRNGEYCNADKPVPKNNLFDGESYVQTQPNNTSSKMPRSSKTVELESSDLANAISIRLYSAP
jgi:hypothetical protein